MGRKAKREYQESYSADGTIYFADIAPVATVIVTTKILQEYTVYIHGMLTVLGVLVLIYIINSEGNPAFKMTWMLCIMAFPVVGTIFYIYVKMQVGTRWMGERLTDLRLETEKYMVQDMEVVKDMKASKSANANLTLSLTCQFLVYTNNRSNIFPIG